MSLRSLANIPLTLPFRLFLSLNDVLLLTLGCPTAALAPELFGEFLALHVISLSDVVAQVNWIWVKKDGGVTSVVRQCFQHCVVVVEIV